MRWISISSRTPAASASCAVPAPWTSTFLSPAARLASDIAVADVVDVGDQRPLPRFTAGLAAAEDEDRHAVVMVAAPATGGLEGASTGDDRPGRHELLDDLAVDATQIRDRLVVGLGPRQDPLVQAVPAVAEPVVRPLIWPGDEPVERHGHVQNGCGHGASLPVWSLLRP